MLKKYNELLNLEATIARELFERVEHPWEVLPLIKNYILELIPNLGDEYKELAENLYDKSFKLNEKYLNILKACNFIYKNIDN